MVGIVLYIIKGALFYCSSRLVIAAIVATYRHNGAVVRRDHTTAGTPPA
ncbi:hypothetical protein K1Y78_48810 [Streptomyces sp. tea 10]|nr:hypothetical protein [Streptomyces sp. tea 10]